MMKTRRSHYELAFEAFLDHRGTAYVPVEDVTAFLRSRAGAKAFDYIVYPPGQAAWLVDVNGRKSSMSAEGTTECRQKTWVTRGDLEGLLAWQRAFGEEFVAGFVFVYWLAGFESIAAMSATGRAAVRTDADEAAGCRHGGSERSNLFKLAGRSYRFWLVGIDDYRQHQKRLSVRWDTISVPRDAFREISRPVESTWPAAPC